MNKYYEVKKQEISSKLGKDSINYIYISDIHYMGISTGQGAVLLEQMKQAVDLANESENIDFVVLGGDTVQGYWDDKRECFEAYREILSVLKNCNKPVLILNGNHDDNAYAAWNPNFSQKIITDFDWQKEILGPYATENRVHDEADPNSKYYYYDFKKNGKAIRIFCLDATDYKTEYDENGVAVKLNFAEDNDENTPENSYKYQTGMSYWGFSAEQIKWFAKALASANFDDVIIFSHMGIDRQTNYRDIAFGDELRNIFRAYKRKTEYKNEELGIDVSYNDGGKVLIYHYGHIHREAMVYFEDIGFWQIASSTARADQADPFAERQADTEKEPCFDIVSVKQDDIRKYNIGGGTDIEYKF